MKTPQLDQPLQLLAAVCLAALALLALTGCSPGEVQTADQTRPREMFGAPLLYTDPDTGCQYLLNNTGGLTPRLDANGKIICTAGDVR